MTVRDYNQVREGAVERGLPDLYPSYKKTLKFRKNHCRPEGIVSKADETYVPFQNVLNFQMDKLLKPDKKQKMIELKNQGATFHLYVKYGNVCLQYQLSVYNMLKFSVANFAIIQIMTINHMFGVANLIIPFKLIFSYHL